jgi:predicted ATPase
MQAEEAVRQALAVAQRYGVKAFELRALLALCRLARAPRDQADARRLLGDVYAWFTEGFDTRDLKAARAELEAGSRPR